MWKIALWTVRFNIIILDHLLRNWHAHLDSLCILHLLGNICFFDAFTTVEATNIQFSCEFSHNNHQCESIHTRSIDLFCSTMLPHDSMYRKNATEYSQILLFIWQIMHSKTKHATQQSWQGPQQPSGISPSFFRIADRAPAAWKHAVKFLKQHANKHGKKQPPPYSASIIFSTKLQKSRLHQIAS